MVLDTFSVPKFDLHIYGNMCIKLRGGVTFRRITLREVEIVNHAFKGKIFSVEDFPYPVLIDDEGEYVGIVARLPRKVRNWLKTFY